MLDALEILKDILNEYADHPKWLDAPFGNIRRVPNTLVGEVGQDFVEKICKEIGFDVEFPQNKKGKRKKQNPWDIKIENMTFEVKTASEDTSGAFQFNHVRYHRPYDALLCIGISPNNILFGVWSKSDVVTGKAGNLATMEKGANASYKLTKKPEKLYPITEFEDKILDSLSKLGA